MLKNSIVLEWVPTVWNTAVYFLIWRVDDEPDF